MNAEPALKVVETTRLCVNCKWCRHPNESAYECHAPQNFHDEFDPVTGGTTTQAFRVHCSPHRMYQHLENHCGREGKWFEPRTGEGEAG